MRTLREKNVKKRRQPVFCVLFLFGVLIAALSLGSIRLYGLYLEQRLADCNMNIESVGSTYAMLEERHASMLSPSRIYNHAKSDLNMVAASQVETIKLLSNSYDGTPAYGRHSESVQAPAGLNMVLVGTANAKN